MRLPYILIIINYSNVFILVITQYPLHYVVDKYFIIFFLYPYIDDDIASCSLLYDSVCFKCI